MNNIPPWMPNVGAGDSYITFFLKWESEISKEIRIIHQERDVISFFATHILIFYSEIKLNETINFLTEQTWFRMVPEKNIIRFRMGNWLMFHFFLTNLTMDTSESCSRETETPQQKIYAWKRRSLKKSTYYEILFWRFFQIRWQQSNESKIAGFRKLPAAEHVIY
jgi:hypothetical protein